MSFDPSVKFLADHAIERWGEPEENIKSAVRFGISTLDNILYGIGMGSQVLIKGYYGNRKSTLALNFVLNIALSGALDEGKRIVIDTLESGMSRERVFDVLVSMLATRILAVDRYGRDRREWPPIQELVEQDEDMRISPEFLRYGRRSKRQLRAIGKALSILRTKPIDIYGPMPEEGNTVDPTKSHQRWVGMCNDDALGVLVIDHVQRYYIPGARTDYDILFRVAPLLADISARNVIVIVLSQVSVGSRRVSAALGIPSESRGGSVLSEGADIVFDVVYDPKLNPYYIVLSTHKSRRGVPPKLEIPIDPRSGAILGLERIVK